MPLGGCKSFLGGGGVRTPQKIRAWITVSEMFEGTDSVFNIND